jgi:hypothetical protein
VAAGGGDAVTLGLGDLAFVGALGPGYDPDAQAYITAVEVADGQALETGVRDAINAFVVGCKADGIWTAIKASCILAGARTLSGALVPLVGAAPTRFGTEGGWNYNRETGLAGNGTNNYLNSNRVGSDQPQNNAHISIWVSAVATSTGSSFPVYIGSYGNTSDSLTGSLHLGRNNNNGTLFGRGVSATYEANLGSGSATGFKGISRSSSASFAYRNNLSSTTVSRTSETPGNAPVLIFAVGGSIASERSNGCLAFYSIGEALGLALLDARVTTLINAIAAAIP